MLQLPASDAPQLRHTDLAGIGQSLEANVALYFEAFNTWSKLAQQRDIAAATQNPHLDFSCFRGDSPEWAILESIGNANGYSAASDLLSKIGGDIDKLSKVVEGHAPNTLEELRAHALRALFDCFPMTVKHNGQFDFQNEVAFERLFNAVLHITGLAPIADKMLDQWAKQSDVSAPC